MPDPRSVVVPIRCVTLIHTQETRPGAVRLGPWARMRRRGEARRRARFPVPAYAAAPAITQEIAALAARSTLPPHHRRRDKTASAPPAVCEAAAQIRLEAHADARAPVARHAGSPRPAPQPRLSHTVTRDAVARRPGCGACPTGARPAPAAALPARPQLRLVPGAVPVHAAPGGRADAPCGGRAAGQAGRRGDGARPVQQPTPGPQHRGAGPDAAPEHPPLTGRWPPRRRAVRC